ncbi:MAG: hypothetical protein NTW21_28330 [Verrucomicrobia bacterium]|nr:hypothetical protein [Verrucomicrobiota bacterium]
MRKKPSRLADTVRMRAWRDRKGGTKPATLPAAPSVLEHWLGKWRESMEERGNSRVTVVCQTDHARHFIRWCHDREVNDPSWISAGLVHAWLEAGEAIVTRWGTPLSRNSLDGRIGCVRRFLGFLCESRAIPSNPLQARKGRKRSSRVLPVVLDERTVLNLLDAPDTTDPVGVRDRAMMEVLYSSGVRRRELATIRAGSERKFRAWRVHAIAALFYQKFREPRVVARNASLIGYLSSASRKHRRSARSFRTVSPVHF